MVVQQVVLASPDQPMDISGFVLNSIPSGAHDELGTEMNLSCREAGGHTYFIF